MVLKAPLVKLIGNHQMSLIYRHVVRELTRVRKEVVLDVFGMDSGGPIRFARVVVEAYCCPLLDAFVPECESKYELPSKRNIAKKRCFGDGSTPNVCRTLMSIECLFG